jgi:hypothetical protein
MPPKKSDYAHARRRVARRVGLRYRPVLVARMLCNRLFLRGCVLEGSKRVPSLAVTKQLQIVRVPDPKGRTVANGHVRDAELLARRV